MKVRVSALNYTAGGTLRACAIERHGGGRGIAPRKSSHRTGSRRLDHRLRRARLPAPLQTRNSVPEAAAPRGQRSHS
jgi:hypothetical protein